MYNGHCEQQSCVLCDRTSAIMSPILLHMAQYDSVPAIALQSSFTEFAASWTPKEKVLK